MTPDASPRPRMRHVATTGTALAGVLLPLAAGMLLARSVGSDPMTPVNTLITHGGQRLGALPGQWRGCRRYALRGPGRTTRPTALRMTRGRTPGEGRAQLAALLRDFRTR
ncbi:hypothetical protein ACF08N_05475 [Streptomyces sp. NPDC015127]|uniref:hypothetical protein n=1 Tax=Streptomyces sp. NPDC015127 TaxID=3364939 RepID=UPI0036F689E6